MHARAQDSVLLSTLAVTVVVGKILSADQSPDVTPSATVSQHRSMESESVAFALQSPPPLLLLAPAAQGESVQSASPQTPCDAAAGQFDLLSALGARPAAAH